MEPTYQTVLTFVTPRGNFELRIYSFNMLILADLDKGTTEEFNYQKFINYSLDKAGVALSSWATTAITIMSGTAYIPEIKNSYKLINALVSYHDSQQYLTSAF